MRTKGLLRRAVVRQWIQRRLSPGLYSRTPPELTVRSGALGRGRPSPLRPPGATSMAGRGTTGGMTISVRLAGSSNSTV